MRNLVHSLIRRFSLAALMAVGFAVVGVIPIAVAGTDGDGIPDYADADIDGDGIPNSIETAATLNELDVSDGALDLDGDGWSNVDEYRLGTNINDAGDTPLGQSRPHQKVFAADGRYNSYEGQPDSFGNSVAVGGDTAVIGAYGDDVFGVGNDIGAAYVFIRSDGVWSQQGKLTANDDAAFDYFGASVAISGDTIVVGAYLDDDNGQDSGSAYVFTRSGTVWTEQDKLTADDGASEDYFGSSVAIDGDTVIVGAYSDDDSFSNSGSAYVFTRSGSTWTQEDKINADDPAADQFFGHAVAVSGDTTLISAHNDDDNGFNSGAAYVFTRSGSTWSQQEKLTADDAAAEDIFGIAIALSGDTALIGAPWDDDDGEDSGSAYIFTRAGTVWTQLPKLTADDAATFDNFGGSVALDGDAAIAGAAGDTDNGNSSGSAYLFAQNAGTWVQQPKLTAADGDAFDQFGNVAIDGDAILVGSPGDSDGGFSSGSAYFFELNSSVRGPLLGFTAIPDFSGDGTAEITRFADPNYSLDLETLSGDDGSVLRTTKFFSDQWRLSAAATLLDGNQDGTGDDPAVVVLANNIVTGQHKVQLRDASSGSILTANLGFFNSSWTTLDVAVLNDINVDGVTTDSAIAVLARRKDNNRNVVEVRQLSNGSIIGKWGFFTPAWTTKALAVVEPFGGVPEFAVLATDPSTNKSKIQTRRLSDGAKRGIFVLGASVDAVDFDVANDLDGNGTANDPAFLTVGKKDGGNNIARVNRFSDGMKVKDFLMVGGSWQTNAIAVTDDSNANNYEDVVTISDEIAGSRMLIKTRDLETGDSLNNIYR